MIFNNNCTNNTENILWYGKLNSGGWVLQLEESFDLIHFFCLRSVRRPVVRVVDLESLVLNRCWFECRHGLRNVPCDEAILRNLA